MSTVDITLENLETTVKENDIVLLDFWAAWCGPCRSFAPVFEQAAETHTNIVFGKIDTEAQQELAAGFGISSIPTLMAFREGIIVFAQPGALNSNQLEQVIDGVTALDMDQVRADIAASDQAEASTSS